MKKDVLILSAKDVLILSALYCGRKVRLEIFDLDGLILSSPHATVCIVDSNGRPSVAEKGDLSDFKVEEFLPGV